MFSESIKTLNSIHKSYPFLPLSKRNSNLEFEENPSCEQTLQFLKIRRPYWDFTALFSTTRYLPEIFIILEKPQFFSWAAEFNHLGIF